MSELDICRARWHRARTLLGMAESGPDRPFASAGLAAQVRGFTARLLILPADPEAHVVEFDEAFQQWWLGSFADPLTGRPAALGRE